MPLGKIGLQIEKQETGRDLSGVSSGQTSPPFADDPVGP